MEYLLRKIQTEYTFTDYQIKLIRYCVTALFYDMSKLIVFCIFFYMTGKIQHLLFALIPMLLLRTKTGGIHFSRYLSCLLFTFAYLYSAINILPNLITIHPLGIYIVLLLCAILDYMIGPNSLTRTLKNGEDFFKKAKIETFQIILILALLFFIFSSNEYLLVSFWTVVLHTVQLAITKIIKEVKNHEKLD